MGLFPNNAFCILSEIKGLGRRFRSAPVRSGKSPRFEPGTGSQRALMFPLAMTFQPVEILSVLMRCICTAWPRLIGHLTPLGFARCGFPHHPPSPSPVRARKVRTRVIRSRKDSTCVTRAYVLQTSWPKLRCSKSSREKRSCSARPPQHAFTVVAERHRLLHPRAAPSFVLESLEDSDRVKSCGQGPAAYDPLDQDRVR